MIGLQFTVWLTKYLICLPQKNGLSLERFLSVAHFLKISPVKENKSTSDLVQITRVLMMGLQCTVWLTNYLTGVPKNVFPCISGSLTCRNEPIAYIVYGSLFLPYSMLKILMKTDSHNQSTHILNSQNHASRGSCQYPNSGFYLWCNAAATQRGWWTRRR